MKPASTSTCSALLVFDLFCGLFGWGEAFAKEGWRVVGFDLEDQFANFGKVKPDNCELVLVDIRSLTGAWLVENFGAPDCIVASPPCQEFSYMAMPWSEAKEKQRKIESDPKERERLCELFNHCFRLQREISEACGHYVPMVVENVRGAQKWVGKARWNFGSFYLWGDVPALMPIPGRVVKNPETTVWRENGCNAENRMVPSGFKTHGMNWSDQSKRGQDFTRIAGKQARQVSPAWRAKHYEKTEKALLSDAAKQPGIGGKRANGKGDAWFQDGAARHGSKSSARKEASAMIAKIPPPLAQWIARVMKPKNFAAENHGR